MRDIDQPIFAFNFYVESNLHALKQVLHLKEELNNYKNATTKLRQQLRIHKNNAIKKFSGDINQNSSNKFIWKKINVKKHHRLQKQIQDKWLI